MKGMKCHAISGLALVAAVLAGGEAKGQQGDWSAQRLVAACPDATSVVVEEYGAWKNIRTLHTWGKTEFSESRLTVWTRPSRAVSTSQGDTSRPSSLEFRIEAGRWSVRNERPFPWPSGAEDLYYYYEFNFDDRGEIESLRRAIAQFERLGWSRDDDRIAERAIDMNIDDFRIRRAAAGNVVCWWSLASGRSTPNYRLDLDSFKAALTDAEAIWDAFDKVDHTLRITR